jgi:N-methylhydantoinase A
MFHIGVDIGGTFTDCVLVGASPGAGEAAHATAKALTTHEDPAAGVLAALDRLTAAVGTDLPTMLARTARLAHGTTIGTNAVLERRGARVGLVTTAGHGDALEIMRGHGRVAGRPPEEVFSVHGTSLPGPLIVPGALLELDERVDASGKVVVALDERTAAERLAAFVAEHDLDSVAVVLLWSFVNAAHEEVVATLLHTVAPQVFVSLSNRVSPRLGEYERAVATVLNGYVGPACTGYLSGLAARLGERGLATPPLVVQSHGGVVPTTAAAEVALGTIDSGPTGGLAGVAALAAAAGHSHVVATDMGGTSFDIGLVVDGRPVTSNEAVIDQYTYRLPRLDVRTVACGGGTIARLDARTGALRVGPDSAGSQPGPACYGLGGHEPTVTDADVVLGLLDPQRFLDGSMPLDAAAARAAVGRLAGELGLGVDETAAGIVSVNNLRAATLVRQQTLERGLDPRDFVLYAYGGAGPLHAFGYAAELGVREVVVPLGNGASTLSAYGIAVGDVTWVTEIETSLLAPLVPEAVVRAVDQAVDRAGRALADLGVAERPEVEVWALMRYREQLMHSLEIPIDRGDPDAAGTLVDRFWREYERRYAVPPSAFQAVEVFGLRVSARVPAPVHRTGSGGEAAPEAASRARSVFWPDAGARLETEIVAGASLRHGHTVRGPALVELAHTTAAVPRGATAVRDGQHVRLHLPDPAGPEPAARSDR